MESLQYSILYLGSSEPSTSLHRANALRRLGCQVTLLDPEALIGSRQRWQAFLDYRTGYQMLQHRMLRVIKSSIIEVKTIPDLIWIDSGELIGPSVLRWLTTYYSCPTVLYNVDDPTGSRDAKRFKSLKASLPLYSLCVFIRGETALEALALGAKRVLTVHRSYDEIDHSPPLAALPPSGKSRVSFIGTLIPGEDRDNFVLELINAGLPLTIIGNRWQRSRHWPKLQSFHQGQARSGSAYAEALGSATLTLGLLSHENRDLITTRSLETPACGGLLCAERTSEHQLLYEQNHEAVMWSSTKECIDQCFSLLAETQRNSRIRDAGLHKVRSLGVGNEDICRQILAFLKT